MPILDGHVAHGLVHRDARVVHEEVDPSPLPENLVDDSTAISGIPDVALMQRDGVAVVLQRGGELIGVID